MEIIAQVKLKGARKVKSVSDIKEMKEGSRLFYELGHRVTLRRWTDEKGNICEDNKWVREGVFKEVYDVADFLKDDKRLYEEEFIEHHNFVIID